MSDEETCHDCGCALSWLSPKRSELGKATCMACTSARIREAVLSSPIDITPDYSAEMPRIEWEPNPDDPFTQVAKAFHETVLPLRNAGSSCTVRKIDGVSYSIEVTESNKCRSRMLGRIEQRLRHRGFSEDEIKEIVDDE
jgi:hypothetical protein